MSKNTIYVEDQQNSFNIIETNGLFESIFYGMFGHVVEQDELDSFVNTYVEHIKFYERSPDEKCKKMLPLIQKFYDESSEQDVNPIYGNTYKDIFENTNCSTQITAIENMVSYKKLRTSFGKFIKTLRNNANYSEYEYIICEPMSDVWKTQINIVEEKSANNYVVRNSYYSPGAPTEKTKTIFILHTGNKYLSLKEIPSVINFVDKENEGNDEEEEVVDFGRRRKKKLTDQTKLFGVNIDAVNVVKDLNTEETKTLSKTIPDNTGINSDKEEVVDFGRRRKKKLTDQTKLFNVNIDAVNVVKDLNTEETKTLSKTIPDNTGINSDKEEVENPLTKSAVDITSPKPTIVQDPTIETIAPFTIKYTINNKEEDLKDLPSTQSAIMRAFKSGKVSTATSIGDDINSPPEQSVRSKVNTTIRNNPDFQGFEIDNIALVNSKKSVAEDLPTKDWYFKVNLKTKNNTGGLRANKKKTQKLKKRRKTQKRVKGKKKSNKSKRRK
jgi:hypothetical protein